MKRRVLRFFRFFIRHRYYDKSGETIKCEFCGSNRRGRRVKESINMIPCEEVIICIDCGKEIGYWAYGNCDPDYRENIFLRASLTGLFFGKRKKGRHE